MAGERLFVKAIHNTENILIVIHTILENKNCMPIGSKTTHISTIIYTLLQNQYTLKMTRTHFKFYVVISKVTSKIQVVA